MSTIKKLLPNLITLTRILMIPVIVVGLYFSTSESFLLAAIAFVVASITDFIDGYLAKVWKVQSNVGKFLDPIADKLIISTTIIMLIHLGVINNLGIFPSLIIICREILISGAREFMGNMRIEIPVTKLAKIKTTLQMTAVTVLTLSGCDILTFLDLNTLGQLTLWIAAIFTVCSGYCYLKAPIKYLISGTSKFTL